MSFQGKVKMESKKASNLPSNKKARVALGLLISLALGAEFVAPGVASLLVDVVLSTFGTGLVDGG